MEWKGTQGHQFRGKLTEIQVKDNDDFAPTW